MKRTGFLKFLLLALSVFVLMGCGSGDGATAQEKAIAKIEAYADTNGTNGQAPTAADYTAAGIDLHGTSVDDINAYIATLDGDQVDSEAEIQAIADAADTWRVDTDGDGTPNYTDTDDDGDGVADTADAFPLDAAESVDTDGDGIGNNADTDDDGDGVSDTDETAAGSDPLDADSIAFKGLVYNVVTSADTGRQWLDRNLGATKVCTKSRDDAAEAFDDAAYVADQKECFGDYYQWGRKTNGHEKSDSAVSDVRLESDADSGGMFIKNPTDWRTTPDDVLWYGKDAINSICPNGFEVPTFAMLRSDTSEATGENKITDRDSAFKNFLHLPAAGYRSGISGALESRGDQGILWASDIYDSQALFVGYNHGMVFAWPTDRTHALSIRCIKSPESPDETVPIATMHNTTDIEVDSNITVTFSEAMDRSTLTTENIRLRKQGSQDYIPISIQETGMRAIIDPAVDLSYATHYVIEVTTEVKDRSGNAIEANTVNINTHEHTFNLEFTTTDGAFTFRGKEYKKVTSPYTHKVWLDRNLGASMVCTKSRDDAEFGDDAAYVADQGDCFGDYYQWGRNADGHEASGSLTTATQATQIDPVQVAVDGKFITDDGTNDHDWAKAVDSDGSTRQDNWSETDGSSVCPAGFRVPTIDELDAELFDWGSAKIHNRDDAFNSFLKFPSAGHRIFNSGILDHQGSYSSVWSSSVNGSRSHYVYFVSSDAGMYDDSSRANGYTVRCLRD